MANTGCRFTMRASALGLILLLSTATGAPAHTPTPTFGPSPTETTRPTETIRPTPTATGTVPIPSLSFSISPNPPRSGQVVTLDARSSYPAVSFSWSQIGPGVRLELEDADQPIAHFTVPLVKRPSIVTVQLTSSDPNRGPKAADLVLLPSTWLTAAVGSA